MTGRSQMGDIRSKMKFRDTTRLMTNKALRSEVVLDIEMISRTRPQVYMTLIVCGGDRRRERR